MLQQLKLFVLLLSTSLTANATLITLQSAWEYQLRPSSSGVSGVGVFTFTVDDTTPISSMTGSPPFQNASYTNAITSATFTLGSLSLHLDTNKVNGVDIYNKDNSGGLDASISAFLLDNTGSSYEMFLGFEMTRDLTTLALSNLDGLNNEDTPWAYIDPETCTINPFVCGYTLRQVGFQSVVPLPASAWLLASGLFSALFFQRKLKNIN